jgi:hypothetical protein
MKTGAPLRATLGLAVVLGAAAFGTGAVRARAPLETLRSVVRAEGITLDARAVERGVFRDTLRDVRANLRGGAVVRAREATLSRSPFGVPSLSTPVLEVTLTDEPIRAFSLLGRVAVPGGIALHASRVSVHYRNRATGVLVLDGVSERSGVEPRLLRAETLSLGAARFADVAFSVAQKWETLEILLGAERGTSARATATYVPSQGRAAEWRVVLPHQPFGELREALGLGAAAPEDATRIGGTLSWIVPDDVQRAARGSCRFVLDGWPRPRWPDASALTGSSGAIAAAIAPSTVGDELRLERVEVAAALFDLRGKGTITLGAAPKVALAASGRRTCAELSHGLAPSRHREAVRTFLGPGSAATPLGTPPDSNATGRAGEWVELALRVELVFGAPGSVRFLWHLSAGCGLPEMTAGGAEGG